MGRMFLIAALVCIGSFAGCNREIPNPVSTNSNQDSDEVAIEFTDRVVGISCGRCQLGMDGEGCKPSS